MYVIAASVKLQWPDALSLPMWRGATFPSEPLLPSCVHRTVNVDIKMEAGSSVPLSSYDCLRGTEGKLRQAEMASLALDMSFEMCQ